MEFTNEVIDTTQLPRFEEVQFTKLHPSYWKVTLINIGIIFTIFYLILGFVMYMDIVYNHEVLGAADYMYEKIGGLTLVMLFVVFLSRIGFKKKSYAFRNHDVLYRHGIIATNTTIIPYNRVQHVALHESFFSRMLGLAKIEIFTAGGSSSDIEIPGIEKEQAENIKQLLMGKIQKEL